MSGKADNATLIDKKLKRRREDLNKE